MEIQLKAGVPTQVDLTSRSVTFAVDHVVHEFKTIPELFLEDALRVRAEGKRYYWFYVELIDPVTGQPVPNHDLIANWALVDELIGSLSSGKISAQPALFKTVKVEYRDYRACFHKRAIWLKELGIRLTETELSTLELNSDYCYVEKTPIEISEAVDKLFWLYVNSVEWRGNYKLERIDITLMSNFKYLFDEATTDIKLLRNHELIPAVKAYLLSLSKHKRLFFNSPNCGYFRLKIPRQTPVVELCIALEGVILAPNGELTRIGKVNQGKVRLTEGSPSQYEISVAFEPTCRNESEVRRFTLEVTSSLDCTLIVRNTGEELQSVVSSGIKAGPGFGFGEADVREVMERARVGRPRAVRALTGSGGDIGVAILDALRQ